MYSLSILFGDFHVSSGLDIQIGFKMLICTGEGIHIVFTQLSDRYPKALTLYCNSETLFINKSSLDEFLPSNLDRKIRIQIPKIHSKIIIPRGVHKLSAHIISNSTQ